MVTIIIINYGFFLVVTIAVVYKNIFNKENFITTRTDRDNSHKKSNVMMLAMGMH